MFVRIKTTDAGDVLLNPADITRIFPVDRYHPGGYCTIVLRDETRIQSYDSINEVEAKVQAVLL